MAIKEGPFYKIFDMCQVHNTNDGTPWWHNPQNLIIRKRGLKDSQTNGFYTIERSDGSVTTYDVSYIIRYINMHSCLQLSAARV